MRNCALHDLRNQMLEIQVAHASCRDSHGRDARSTLDIGRSAMDWRVLLTTFGVIFLAEMGDKTQIAAMSMAAEKKRPWEVFIGASLALVAVSAVGVIVGSVLSQYLPLDWIK